MAEALQCTFYGGPKDGLRTFIALTGDRLPRYVTFPYSRKKMIARYEIQPDGSYQFKDYLQAP